MTRLLAGTYADAGGPGLVPILHDPDTDAWTVGAPAAHIRNASFGVAGRRHLYWVDEAAGSVGVHDRRGTPLARIDTGGEAPCHLALDPGERRLAIANYGNGRVTLVDLDPAGLPAGRTVLANSGSGPDAERQEGPHAHWVGFGAGGDLVCVDLGADRILSRAPDAPEPPHILYAAPPGSGPRHLAFHPALPVAWLVSELAATLTVLRPDGAGLRADAILPTAPAGVETLGGAIALDAGATRLYATTRGHDSIATFALDADGNPRLLGHVPSGGASPRFILPLARHLLVAHEQAGGVAVFRLGADGCPLPGPVMLDVPGAAFLMPDPGE